MADNKMIVKSLGGVSGLIQLTSQDAAGNPLTAQNGINRNLRLLSFEGAAWNEGLCIAAERAAIAAAQAVLDGSNTFAGHIQALGMSLDPAILADVELLSQQIGVKITFENSVPLLAAILGNHGVIAPNVAKLLPTVVAAIQGYLKK